MHLQHRRTEILGTTVYSVLDKLFQTKKCQKAEVKKKEYKWWITPNHQGSRNKSFEESDLRIHQGL
jgi:hypothetical protein